jgi:hypothetical protein
MAGRARGRLVRVFLAALVSAGVIAATGLAAVALAEQAGPGTGSAGGAAVTGADTEISPTASSSPSSGPPSLSLSAGPDQTVVGTTVVQLAGSVSDPAATTSWSQVSGPPATTYIPAGSATFDGTSPATTATVTEAGVYVFRLTALDGSQTASATVTITFNVGLDAGTFISLTYPGGGILGCTTGFAVAKAGVDYELEAKHCIDGDAGETFYDQYLQQVNNNAINNTDQPMKIAQIGSPATVYAGAINCTPPAAACLLPESVKTPGSDLGARLFNYRYETGDMMAWQSTGAVPSALVQTAYGLLPVIGAKTLSDISGQPVCHYGYGSIKNVLQPEQCGTAPNAVKESLLCFAGNSSADGFCPPETEVFTAPGYSGDSGGPVYSYDMINGTRVGVYAIGIVTGASQKAVVFIPIAELESRLGATLVTTDPLP